MEIEVWANKSTTDRANALAVPISSADGRWPWMLDAMLRQMVNRRCFSWLVAVAKEIRHTLDEGGAEYVPVEEGGIDGVIFVVDDRNLSMEIIIRSVLAKANEWGLNSVLFFNPDVGARTVLGIKKDPVGGAIQSITQGVWAHQAERLDLSVQRVIFVFDENAKGPALAEKLKRAFMAA